jgi:hypothetical protein
MTSSRLVLMVNPVARMLLVYCVLGGIVAAGCSGAADQRPPRVPFQARVLLGETPVEGAVVVLAPAEGGGSAASGISDATGVVTFSTFGSRDGVLPGQYVVTVSKVAAGSGEAADADDPNYDPSKAVAVVKSRNALPDRYATATTSGLTVEVSAAPPEPLDLRLTP